jgi:hypothetical protein
LINEALGLFGAVNCTPQFDPRNCSGIFADVARTLAVATRNIIDQLPLLVDKIQQLYKLDPKAKSIAEDKVDKLVRIGMAHVEQMWPNLGKEAEERARKKLDKSIRNVTGKWNDPMTMFFWLNLLLDKGDRWFLSPLSGYIPNSVVLSGRSIFTMLQRCELFKSLNDALQVPFTSATIVDRTQTFWSTFFFRTPSNLADASISQTIVTNGVELRMSASNPNKPKGFFTTKELSYHFYNMKVNGQVETKVDNVLGVDAGERFPVAAVSIEIGSGKKTKWNVARGSFDESTREARFELEELKRCNGVHGLEEQLGSTATKRSYDYEQFRTGYFAAWLKTREQLLQFYGRRSIRHQQLRRDIRQQQHNDRLTTVLLRMVGARPYKHPDNATKLVVIGEPYYIPRPNAPPSRHTTFWDHFRRKVRIIAPIN